MKLYELHLAKLAHDQDNCDLCLDFKLDMTSDAQLAEGN